MTTETPSAPGANRAGDHAEEIGAALRELAATEEAPTELDRLLEPLRLQDSQPPLVRPALRWAALAAAVLAGAFWLPHLAHRAAAPQSTTSTARIHNQPGHYYQLQPLPTADPEDLPETAAQALERLAPTEPLPTPVPLEVLGPTEESPSGPELVVHPRSLVVVGRKYELLVPDSVPATPLTLHLTVKNGRVTKATTATGQSLAAGLLEALAPLQLDGIPDGKVPARLASMAAPDRRR